MRILQIIHGFPPKDLGGVEIYAHRLSCELAKRHEVFVFYRMNRLDMPEYGVSREKAGDFNIFALNNTFRYYDSFEDTYQNDRIAEKFEETLNEIKPDVVHIQHLLYLSVKIIEKIKERGVPIVFTLQDYWLMCPQGQFFKNNLSFCQDYDSASCINCVQYQLCIRKNISEIYLFLRRFSPSWFFSACKNLYLNFAKSFWMKRENAYAAIRGRALLMKEVCSSVDLFIAPSEFIKNKFVEFGINEEKIKFLPYGFPTDGFGSIQKTRYDVIRFGFIGNLMPAKGIHTLIQSFETIDPKRAELKIYGRSASYKSSLANYESHLKKTVRKKNIKFMGGVDNKEIPRVFENLDILVVPSLWPENSPLIIQEAFLAKVPVLAARIGGIPELVKDNINGLLFEPGNVLELRSKIQQLIDEPEILQRLRAGKSFVENIDLHTQKIEKIYAYLKNEAR